MDRERTPVLVGVAQYTHREKTDRQLDVVDMMANVGRDAVRDAGLDGVPSIDALCIVNCLSKALQNPAAQLSERLGVQPSWSGYSSIGATAPQWFVNRAAEKIWEGSSEWTLVCGAEAFYTKEPITPLTGLVQSHVEVEERMQTPFVGDTRMPVTALELRYNLVRPVDMYALFENARRAHKRQTIEGHRRELAGFCAGLSQSATDNRFAWSQQPRDPDTVVRVTKHNRMVSFPYTKLMCSNAQVNQAAAVLMTSMAQAEAVGISKDQMVFIRGCGEAEDIFHPSERPNLWESPSVGEAVDQAVGQASLARDQLDYLDLYSCFPSAPRIVADMLGLPAPEDASITGGMACFGGPGNNYSLHAICRLVELLRQEPTATGLAHSLSWYLSKHCVGVYSARPGQGPWRREGTIPKAPSYRAVPVIEEAEGAATLESYALSYGRDGEPERATVLGRDRQHNRFCARIALEREAMRAMTETEIIGRSGTVRYDRSIGMNVFTL